MLWDLLVQKESQKTPRTLRIYPRSMFVLGNIGPLDTDFDKSGLLVYPEAKKYPD